MPTTPSSPTPTPTQSTATPLPAPALQDTPPISLLTTYQLRRENAALLSQLQDILFAVKEADGERREEMQRLVGEVKDVARRWDGASEQVKGLAGATTEMVKELFDIEQMRKKASAATTTEGTATTAVNTNTGVISPVRRGEGPSSQPVPEEQHGASPAPTAVETPVPTLAIHPARARIETPVPVHTAQPSLTIPSPRPRRLRQGSLTLTDYTAAYSRLVQEALTTDDSAAGQAEREKRERDMIAQFVRRMAVRAEKVRLVEELELWGWAKFDKGSRGVEFFCGWEAVERVVRGWEKGKGRGRGE